MDHSRITFLNITTYGILRYFLASIIQWSIGFFGRCSAHVCVCLSDTALLKLFLRVQYNEQLDSCYTACRNKNVGVAFFCDGNSDEQPWAMVAWMYFSVLPSVWQFLISIVRRLSRLKATETKIYVLLVGSNTTAMRQLLISANVRHLSMLGTHS